MKKTALFFISILTILSICACGKGNTAKYELTDILNNKISFTSET